MKTKYIIISLILPFLFISQINAESCDKEDIARLKDLAEHVDVAYKNIEYETIEEISKSYYNIKLENLTEELYAIDNNTGFEFNDKNKEEKEVYAGDRKIDIYSNNCNIKLRTISISLKYYNIYYETDLCKDYHNKISSCNEWIDEYVDIDIINNEISEYNTKPESESNNIVDIVKDNYMYIIIAIILLIAIVLIITIIFNKRRSRLV